VSSRAGVLLFEALKYGLSLKSRHLTRLGIRVLEVTRKLYELGAEALLTLPSLELLSLELPSLEVVISGDASCIACSFTF
jgi:hypothetical protein